MKIILALLIFSAIILFHELGHFLLAKKNKIVVTEFSLGMGPRLLSTEKNGTRSLYSFGSAYNESFTIIQQSQNHAILRYMKTLQ